MTTIIYVFIFVSALVGITVGFTCAAAFTQTRNARISKIAEDSRDDEHTEGMPDNNKGPVDCADSYAGSDTNSVSMAEFESSLSGMPEPEIILRRQKIEDDQYNMLKHFTKSSEIKKELDANKAT
jgi:MFS superfamily sulfate permease-like transporter